MVMENIEGRERYPVNVRYSRDLRDIAELLRRVLIATDSGAQIPIEQVGHILFSRGPATIRDEDGGISRESPKIKQRSRSTATAQLS